MTISPIPAEAITALLEEDGLPDSLRQVLAQAKTYQEQCLAIHKVSDQLSPSFEQSFNTQHGTLLANAKTTAALYLIAHGLMPSA